MDFQEVFFGTIGGLAVFLFGMTYMSDGLKNMGSESLKKLLNTVTKNRIYAICVGMVITCTIQSSSATSVIVLGFVNAGLLLLEQAVAVVLGADIGTTITAWFVSTMGIGKINIKTYALPVIGVGFFLNFVAKSQKKKMIGQALLGFGLLFLGLGIMSDGVKSIKESESVMDFFREYGQKPVFGILTGAIFTMIIQSSSATIAVIQVMAFQGIFGLETALPIMFGSDIGTTITAQLAAIGGTKNARAVANANTLFKVMAVLLFLPLLVSGWYQAAVIAIVPDIIVKETGLNSTIMVQIAIAHTAYITISVFIFSTILWRVLLACTRKVTRIGRDAGEVEVLRYMDPLLLKTPTIALEQCVKEVAYMTRQCHKNISVSFEAFIDKDLKESQKVENREEEIDALQSTITGFLVEVGRMGVSQEESRLIPKLIHSVNDAERIGDHAENLLELTQLAIDKKISLTLDAKRALLNYFGLVDRQFKAVIKALETRDGVSVAEALSIEKQLNEDQGIISRDHVDRLEKGSCSVQAGVIFLDVVANLEKIGDHLTNIAERVKIRAAGEKGAHISGPPAK